MPEDVVTADRAGRLRIALWAALVPASLGILSGGYLLFAVVPDERDALRYAVVVTVISLLVAAALADALRRLTDRDRRARTASRVAAVLSLVGAVVLLPVGAGYFLGLVGIVLALLAFLKDEPA